jgi:hypothetical protein
MRLRLVTLLALLAPVLSAAAADRALADPGPGGPIMPVSEVHGGMDCAGETVVHGTTISPFGVHVIDIVQDPVEGARILVRVSGAAVAGTGVAEGFSGSPVYCPDAVGTMENIGAISEGVGQFGNDVVLVTPIEQMLGEPITPPSSAPRLAEAGRPLLAPLTVGGLSPSLVRLLVRAAKRAGRVVLSAPAGASEGFPVQSLVPGASVAASYSAGAVPFGAIGTVTYRDGQNVYAFGHELDDAGRRSLLLQDAYVYDVIGNPSPGPDTSYKLASPGHTVGTLTSDTPNAVIGTVGPPPTLIPVNVTARDRDTGAVLTLQTQVADETDVGLPLGTNPVDLIAPAQVAQAAAQIFNGAPANESGHMCFAVALRESRRPLRFCNRYVGSGIPGDLGGLSELSVATASDASSALGVLDGQEFATLHITRVDASISASRGLNEASIVSARAPRRVHAGQKVPVHLRIRMYRGPVQTVSFPVRIPRDARGALAANVSNPSGGGGSALDALLMGLTGAMGGGSRNGGRPPTSIATLRKQFAATSVYDGLAISFGDRRPTHAYDDPSLLITGRARLMFRVTP